MTRTATSLLAVVALLGAFGAAQIASAAVIDSTFGIDLAGDYVPYTGGGDPEGLTSPDYFTTGSIGEFDDYVPYTGLGDPNGLTSPVYFLTGSIGSADYVPYTGFGDPARLTMPR